MNQNLLKKYQEIEIQTSSPEKLVLLLYDGAIKFLNQAILKIEEKNVEESHQLLIKVQKIIRELMCSLNLETGKLAANWYNLYDYMYERVVEANLNKDIEPIQEVLELINPLREAWAQIIEKDNFN